MNAAQLFDQFECLIEVPDSIPRLRRFILDLAIRGKLADTHTTDEPASEILKRIFDSTRERKISGKYVEPKSFIDIGTGELPFSVPSHWSWARLVEIADVSYGFAFESSRFNNSKVGMPLIRIRDISKTDTEAYFDGPYDPQYVVEAGDYLIGMDGNFNVRKWSGIRGLLNQRVARVNNWRKSLVASFLEIPLQVILDYLHSKTSQTTVKHLSAKQLNGVYLPIPPIAEQHRIVDKVDELMTLCDRLEAAQQCREISRERLAKASLQLLIQPVEPENTEHVHFFLQQLPRLTNNTSQIKALRQAILSLAIQGRLVRQNGDTESAETLLKRLHSDIKAYGLENRVKPAVVDSVSDDVIPFELPKSWSWTRLASICNVITDGDHLPPPKADDGVAFLTIGNISAGYLDFSNCRYVSRDYFDKITTYRRPVYGDLLYTVVGATYGRPVMVDTASEFCVQRHIAIIKPARDISRHYLHLLLKSSFVYDQATRCLTGTAQPTLPLRPLRNFLIPLPPLEEQYRIVKKAEELLKLCDQLEVKVSTALTDSRYLLENLLNNALGVATAVAEEMPLRPLDISLASDQQSGKASLYMTSNPVTTVNQLLECIDDLGGSTTPDRLITHAGLSEDLETFYDLLRAARDTGSLIAPLGYDEAIRRSDNAS
ncbi:restriction endonuclease subunit S [Pseudomonas syringae]|uniref:restriction endonuclease subunit S n=1 Tax=Pseudomonas syringae TaxID=317 RepID=UPI001BCFC948|nr:restriction endonuclease subunit S [Pseudomonas syringae]MBS7460748.1 restriction endonuclease subunit S [Pseudomonas syringae]